MIEKQMAGTEKQIVAAEKQMAGAEKRDHIAISVQIQTIAFILVSVFLGAAGQLLFKAALNQTGGLTLALAPLLRLATNPLMLLGLAVFAVSALLWLIALMKAELSFAYPFLSISYITVMIGGTFFFGDEITVTRIAGVVLIVVGLLIIAQERNTGIKKS